MPDGVGVADAAPDGVGVADVALDGVGVADVALDGAGVALGEGDAVGDGTGVLPPPPWVHPDTTTISPIIEAKITKNTKSFFINASQRKYR
jgi:hypothetical protein